jgi:hypothetical protein
MKKKRKDKRIATLIIHDADKMTPGGKVDIANWLRRTGAHLVKQGDNYSPRFKASYNV